MSYYSIYKKFRRYLSICIYTPKNRTAKATENKICTPYSQKGKKKERIVSQAPWLSGPFSIQPTNQPCEPKDVKAEVKAIGSGQDWWKKTSRKVAELRFTVSRAMIKTPIRGVAPFWYLYTQWRHHGTSSAQNKRAPKLKIILQPCWITIFFRWMRNILSKEV